MGLYQIRHSLFWPYYNKVYRRLRVFEDATNKALATEKIEARIRLAGIAAQRAIYQATGYYASPDLEKIYLEIAATLPDVKCSPVDDSVLHVMTQAYESGGHTRVVQRWIDLSKKDEKHDVVVLNEEQYEIPKWLYNTVLTRNGHVIRFDEKDILKRAIRLRELAANYERIILHVHMDDPTALIAFGVESFTTPIIYFNHADHLFWLGVSIADVVADLRCDHISYSRRNVSKSYTLGIPCAPMKEKTSTDKNAIRRELGIPENDFVLITTGMPIKYRHVGDNCLCKQFVEIVKKEKDVSCYAIGPDFDTEYWQWANDVSNGKIHPLGVIHDKTLYQKYLLAADLYVGSYPYPGYTSTMDAVQYGLPFVQLLMYNRYNGFLEISPDDKPSSCLCYTTKELINRVIALKRDKTEYDNALLTSQKWAHNYVSQEQWQMRLYDMYSQCPKQHHIHPFEIIRGKHVIIDDDVCLLGLLYEKEKFDIHNPLMRKLANAWLRIKGL